MIELGRVFSGERGKKDEALGLSGSIRSGTEGLCRSEKASLLAAALFPFLKNKPVSFC